MSSQSVVLIGAGNVAFHLGPSLQKAGYEIRQVYSHTLANAELLARKINAQAIASLSDIDPSADIYIVAVKDSSVTQVAKALKLPGKIIAHTSGVLDKDILEAVSNHYGVFYPLQTFTKQEQVDFHTIPFCIEGSDEKTAVVLTEVAKKLGSQVFMMSSEQRAVLHVAAVFTNNFVNQLLSYAKAITESAEIPFEILKPLAVETIRKAFDSGPENVQTGPAVRNDLVSIEKHKALLSSEPEMLKVYSLLTALIRQRYQ